MIIHLLQRYGRETVPVLDDIADRELDAIPYSDGAAKLGGVAGPILDGTASTWSSSRASSGRCCLYGEPPGQIRMVLPDFIYALVHLLGGECPCQLWTVLPIRTFALCSVGLTSIGMAPAVSTVS